MNFDYKITKFYASGDIARCVSWERRRKISLITRTHTQPSPHQKPLSSWVQISSRECCSFVLQITPLLFLIKNICYRRHYSTTVKQENKFKVHSVHQQSTSHSRCCSPWCHYSWFSSSCLTKPHRRHLPPGASSKTNVRKSRRLSASPRSKQVTRWKVKRMIAKRECQFLSQQLDYSGSAIYSTDIWRASKCWRVDKSKDITDTPLIFILLSSDYDR